MGIVESRLDGRRPWKIMEEEGDFFIKEEGDFASPRAVVRVQPVGYAPFLNLGFESKPHRRSTLLTGSTLFCMEHITVSSRSSSINDEPIVSVKVFTLFCSFTNEVLPLFGKRMSQK